MPVVVGTARVRGTRHRLTDPACLLHRTPRTPWGRWWYDRNRGRSCPVCVGLFIPVGPNARAQAILETTAYRAYRAGLITREAWSAIAFPATPPAPPAPPTPPRIWHRTPKD